MPNTAPIPSVGAVAVGQVQRPTGPFPDFDTAAAAFRDRQRLVQQVTAAEAKVRGRLQQLAANRLQQEAMLASFADDEVALRAELNVIASELARLS